MSIPVTEAERTPEGARDRFRCVTQGALDRFQATVIAGGPQATFAATRLREAGESAAMEYRRNITLATVGTLPAPATDPADLTCEDP